MNLELCIIQLTENAARIQGLVTGVSVNQARWKPDPDTWSLLEVVNHLYDEERQDFCVRLDVILHHPQEPWPPIDPTGWVTERAYNQRELDASLDNFAQERTQSLAWLKRLSSPNWDTVYKAPFGEITAGDIFASWVAHDLLHMRQMIELHWAYVGTLIPPYRTQYAGSWE